MITRIRNACADAFFHIGEWLYDATHHDPLDELFEAVDIINLAWKEAPKGYSIWIDWDKREVVVTQWQHPKPVKKVRDQ